MKLSTPLRNAVAAAFASITDCVLYTGAIPSTGDTAPTGTVLAKFSTADGSGLTFLTAANGAFSIDTASARISSAAIASGTVGYASLNNGGGAAFNLFCTVGTSGAEVNLSSLSILVDETVFINSLSLTIPAT